jgi:hypothetical protein
MLWKLAGMSNFSSFVQIKILSKDSTHIHIKFSAFSSIKPMALIFCLSQHYFQFYFIRKWNNRGKDTFKEYIKRILHEESYTNTVTDMSRILYIFHVLSQVTDPPALLWLTWYHNFQSIPTSWIRKLSFPNSLSTNIAYLCACMKLDCQCVLTSAWLHQISKMETGQALAMSVCLEGGCQTLNFI